MPYVSLRWHISQMACLMYYITKISNFTVKTATFILQSLLVGLGVLTDLLLCKIFLFSAFAKNLFVTKMIYLGSPSN